MITQSGSLKSYPLFLSEIPFINFLSQSTVNDADPTAFSCAVVSLGLASPCMHFVQSWFNTQTDYDITVAGIHSYIHVPCV